MSKRESILHANRVAASFLEASDARARIKDGYTRIDPVLIAEAHDVAVCFKKMEQLLGAFVENPEPGILVNHDRPAGLVLMTAAHELGHFALEHGTTADLIDDHYDSNDLKEVEADAFAAALLVPRWLLAPTIKDRRLSPSHLRNPAVLYQLSLRLGISYTALLSTLVRMQIMTWGDTTSLRSRQPHRAKVASLINGQQLEDQADIWVLTPADKDHVLEPRPIDRFVLDVPNHLSAGYLWTIDEARSAGFTLVPQKAPPATMDVSDAVAPASDHVQYEVNIRGGGSAATSAELVFVEMQPWRQQSADDVKFQIRTEFGDFADGLTDGTRRRRIEASRSGD